ncbi:lipopolysaccharide biosynthesis protein [Billgrantia pellis]|uniref:Lipopolysaccharide biosynthesis protein n=1 Tax=Billgrantia pellis TaxID=2606936 RepID=A0A7V7G4H3_9GAMM|nr:Wzz/FepE/Etk N-terminal domain-containing protein [Halomonas pellis]KAA0014602.1 lipopolysaccharide biosynthesis protein [Halomonas pellis]
MTTPSTSPHDPQPYANDDEISLIDLTKILIKRWKTLVVTFGLVVLAALAYAFLTDRTYQYTSLYHVAEQATSGGASGLESPNAVIAKIQNLYMGPTVRELRETAKLERLPFDVSVNNPTDTLLVRLESETSEENSDLVSQLHERLLEKTMEDQQMLLERNRERLEQQLASAEQALDAAEQGEASGELLATYVSRIAELEARLAQLNEGQIAQVAVQSLEPTGTSRTLILALGIVLGGVLALMAAFMLHFASLVRTSLQEES